MGQNSPLSIMDVMDSSGNSWIESGCSWIEKFYPYISYEDVLLILFLPEEANDAFTKIVLFYWYAWLESKEKEDPSAEGFFND